MKTKVCGMRASENIQEIAALGIQMMGFIFYPKSPRFVGENFCPPDLDDSILKVGVFVNENLTTLLQRAKEAKLDAIQLHGDESPEFCEKVKKTSGLIILKAFGIANQKDFDQLKNYEHSCDYFVLDSKGISYGGNGKSWDHSILDHVTINTPFLVSGGIDENFTFQSIHPLCVGVDINSRFEDEPALKNVQKIKRFLANE